ncbi:hypothetical protein BH10ACT1_BH10ACT1_02220 [soil metagenome]
MTDLIRAVPATLRAYSEAAVAANGQVDAPLSSYATAWSAFLNAPMTPGLSRPGSKDPIIRGMVAELEQLDREPAALAEALELLDADRNGTLTTDDCTSATFVDLFVRERLKDPTATVDAIRARANLVNATGQELFTVVRDGSDGQTRVVSLNIDALGPLEGASQADLQEILAAYGLVGADGKPLHFVIHGWNGDSTSAAEHTADQYDDQGVDGATVVAVNWDADSGKLSFGDAEDRARETGDALAPLFTALAAENPTANVSITAHSLGNHVALRALSQMQDAYEPWTCQRIPFQVDYLGVEPAIPADSATKDPDHYGALTSNRIRNLTLTINANDGALFWYEVQGPSALGDEAADAGNIKDIQSARDDKHLGTDIVDQNSDDGDGHLGIDPHSSELVEALVNEQIQRGEGGGDVLTQARRAIYDAGNDAEVSWGGLEVNGDTVMESDAVQDYLASTDGHPDLDRVREIATAEAEAQEQAVYDAMSNYSGYY